MKSHENMKTPIILTETVINITEDIVYAVKALRVVSKMLQQS
jgi:hypothetical protein